MLGAWGASGESCSDSDCCSSRGPTAGEGGSTRVGGPGRGREAGAGASSPAPADGDRCGDVGTPLRYLFLGSTRYYTIFRELIR